MKKHLLFLSGIFFFFLSFSQNIELNKKATGIINAQMKNQLLEQSGNENQTNLPVKVSGVKHQQNSEVTNKTSAANKFTSSMNAYGVLNSSSKPLQFTPNVNIISFIHRKSPTYITSPFSNSGSIVGMISTNNGVSWDSTCIWTSTASIGARYPQGGIYNPIGNTNKNNTYLVGCGPLLDGSIGWIGNFYASKSLNGAGTPTPGTDQQAHLDASPTIKKHALSMYSFSSIEGGLMRSMGNIVNNPNSNSPAIYGLRGASMTKGQFIAGSFVWNVDSFIPCVLARPGGGKYLSEKVLQAWNENGTIGYVILLGVPCGANPCQKSFQPIVYKTTNSGVSWALLPQATFNAPMIKSRIASVNTNSNLAVPYFNVQEGWDAVVDFAGELHLSASVVGAYSTHIDSLDYVYTFGPQQYKHAYGGSFGYPTIYDFRYYSSGSWGVMLVDSMGTELVPAIEPANPWINGMLGKLEIGARIQMSRTTDGRRIFYSWTESDSTVVGGKWNIYPDLKMKSYDWFINKLTPRLHASSGITNADQQSYFHFMSPKAIGSSTSCAYVPFTITHNSTLDGSLPVNHYYIDNVGFCSASYSVSTSSFGNFYQALQNCNVVGMHENTDITSQPIVYPNPSEGVFTIGSNNGEIKKIVVMDVFGRHVYETQNLVNDKFMTINLSEYSKGIYFVTIESENNFKTEKIIIK